MPIDALTACAHVADVARSVDFYRHLGLEVQSSYESEGNLVWALVARPGDTPGGAGARLMLALASGVVDAGSQAVLFYCWTPDVQGLHDELTAAGIEVGGVTRPLYMPAGEFRAEDPDGHVLLTTRAERLAQRMDRAARGSGPATMSQSPLLAGRSLSFGCRVRR